MKNRENLIIAIVITVLLLFANFSFWYNKEILNSKNFVNTTTTALLQEDSKKAIASEVVNTGLRNRPLLKNVLGSYGESAIYSLLSNEYFQTQLREAASNIHLRMVSPNNPNIGISIVPIKQFVLPLVTLINPNLTENIKVDELPDRIVLIPQEYIPPLHLYTPAILWIGWISFIAMLVLSLYYLYKYHTDAASIKILGLSVIVGTIFMIIVAVTIQPVFLSTVTSANVKIIAENILSAFFTTYILQTIVLFGIGVIITAVGYGMQYYFVKNKHHSNHKR